MTFMHEIGVAVVGCGTVGGAVCRHLIAQSDAVAHRTGVRPLLRAVVDRDFSHARSIGLPNDLLIGDLASVLERRDVAVVVELAGGVDGGASIVRAAIEAGKHVVTANKAMLAHLGPDLIALARSRGVALAFEASCGGAIPIVRALYDGLAANRVDAILGIVNGTSNYILTEMAERGALYDEALAAAQKAGYAEADPTLDVDGSDAAHKITILASIAFCAPIPFDRVKVRGIAGIDSSDVAYGRRLGYVLKLVARAIRYDGGIDIAVEPTFLPRTHPLSRVDGPFNAVSVYASPSGHTMYYGRGAGGDATSSAVIADILSIGTGFYGAVFPQEIAYPSGGVGDDRLPEIGPGPTLRKYYCRLQVTDHAGTLATVTGILARHEVSIAAAVQRDCAAEGSSAADTSSSADATATIVFTTHATAPQKMQKAREELTQCRQVLSKPQVIPLLDAPPEPNHPAV